MPSSEEAQPVVVVETPVEGQEKEKEGEVGGDDDDDGAAVEELTSVYYRISLADPNHYNEVSPEELAPTTAYELTAQIPDTADVDVTPLHMTSAAKRMSDKCDKTNNNQRPSVCHSWRVSSEEFVVKIDMSPLHVSAARRMFQKNTTTTTTTTTKTKTTDAALVESVEETETGETGTADAAASTEEAEPTKQQQYAQEWSEFWNKMIHLYTKGSGKGEKDESSSS